VIVLSVAAASADIVDAEKRSDIGSAANACNIKEVFTNMRMIKRIFLSGNVSSQESPLASGMASAREAE
jgi:hypothetical protein